MNPRLFIIISLALNLALGVMVWRGSPRSAPPAPAPAPVAAAVAGAPAVVTVSTPVAEPFAWSRLASSDFKKYRDNLRGVGCPEPTVRDIITSEINARFQERRRALLEDFQRRFWDTLARDRELKEDGEWRKPLEKLAEERTDLLADVLGDEPPEPGRDPAQDFRRSMESRYDWLPEERRALLVGVEMEFHTRQEALQKEVSLRTDSKWTDADRAQMKSLNDGLDAARKGILTAEELAEFQLRTSSAARWAASLPGFEASESEWRTVAAHRMEYDEALQKLGRDATPEIRSQMENEWQAQLKSALGEERYGAYTLAQDNQYQQVRRVTQRFGLAEGVATQAYEVQKFARAAAERLHADKSLDSAARRAALAAIQQEARQALEEMLGQNVFPAYQRYAGQWLKGLNPPPEK